MRPKDRVLMAINHQEPDRVPMDYSATPEMDEILMSIFGLNSHEEILEKFQIDFRYIAPEIKIPTFGSFFGDPLIKDLGNGIFEDIWGAKFKKIDYELGSYTECVENPWSLVKNISDLDRFEQPDVHAIWDFSTIKAQAEKYQDFAVIFNGAVLLQFCQPLRGINQLMMDLHDQPHLAQAILKKVVDYWIELGTSILEAADGLIDIFVINDDYGMQQGPMFNPQIWREYLKPLIQDAINAYRAYDVKIMFHSCGSIISFIPDFIEMGVNILDPVQVSAKSMDLHYLKKEFGKSLCFRGAIDTQRILPCGSFDEVREAVKSTINLLAEGGGYFLTSVHNLQPDVKPENILAMYEEGLTSGQYPIKLEK